MMMRVLRDGVRDAVAHWPSALLLYAAVTVPAAIAGYVFQTSLLTAFGKSAALDTLTEGFAYTTFFDLSAHEGFRLVHVVALSAAFFVISLPAHSFLTAGLVAALAGGGAWSLDTYLIGAARHAGRFILLSLGTLVAVLLIALLSIGAAGSVFLETEDASHPGVLVFLALGAFVSACLITLGDYARLVLVQEPERGLVGSIRAAMEFSVRHAGGAVVLMLALTIASSLPVLGVALFERAIPLSVGGWLIPLVIVQQAAVMLRSWIRVFAFASQASFLRSASGALRTGEIPPTPSPFLARGL